MATKGRRSDEGGSGAETKGRVPAAREETRQFEGPYGDTELSRDLDELEEEGLAAGGQHDVERGLGRSAAGRREEIASNPDNEEELAEEALESSAEWEDEATHDRRHRG